MAVRGIRGAIDVRRPDDTEVHDAVRELLGEIVAANECTPDDVAALVFTVTDDLVGANPAAAARACGWAGVPLLMTREHGGDRRLARCIRVLALWNTSRPQSAVRHAYLRGAAVLRPDLVSRPS